MDERISPQNYVRIWMTSSTLTEVVRRVAGELGHPITVGEALLIARRLRREGVRIPVRPGGATGRGRVILTPRPDGDYRDGHGRGAYRVGPGTRLEGPWVCTRCRRTMWRGFILLPTPDAHWPVCGRCAHVAG